MSKYRIVESGLLGGGYNIQQRFLWFWITWRKDGDPTYGGDAPRWFKTVEDAESFIRWETRPISPEPEKKVVKEL